MDLDKILNPVIPPSQPQSPISPETNTPSSPMAPVTTVGSTSPLVSPHTQSRVKESSSHDENASSAPKTPTMSGIRLRINFKPGSERITVIQRGAPSRECVPKEHLNDDTDFTDSDIEITPTSRKKAKISPPISKKEPESKEAPVAKKTVALKQPPTASKTAIKSKLARKNNGKDGDSDISGTDSSPPVNSLNLVHPTMKRKARIVNPDDPDDAVLIASATKASTDIYDSDAEVLPNEDLKNTSVKNKPLFRNVVWGPAASDYSNAASFPLNPEFTQFIPGRWERMDDGTITDQKAKLIVKFTDDKGNKRIFANPPPQDWNNQKAITALNKRTVQQIRRNTDTRFRSVVVPYIPEERRWILAHLTSKGKPTSGWKSFVDNFNAQFANKIIAGHKNPRPARSHSSLTKEVDRYNGDFYSQGLVPGETKAKKATVEAK